MKTKLTRYLTDFSNLKLTRPIPDKVRLLEIFGVILTGVGKFVFMDYFNWRLPFVVITILAWSFYVHYRYKKDNNVLKDWGFRKDNFKSVFILLLPFIMVSILLFFVIGYIQGTINMTWHIIPLLITYPIWGSIQQFLTIGLLAGNLKDLKSVKLNKIIIIFTTAIFFSIVHYPSGWLMLGTFILALLYGYMYLKAKNIYVLGIVHGWLGALFYYTVVGQDPFADIFLKYLCKINHVQSNIIYKNNNRNIILKMYSCFSTTSFQWPLNFPTGTVKSPALLAGTKGPLACVAWRICAITYSQIINWFTWITSFTCKINISMCINTIQP